MTVEHVQGQPRLWVADLWGEAGFGPRTQGPPACRLPSSLVGTELQTDALGPHPRPRSILGLVPPSYVGLSGSRPRSRLRRRLYPQPNLRPRPYPRPRLV